jgi:superfamily II DNA or RNA helicase/HKD family nuclease
LRREAASCDGLDILVSFITVSGVRKLIDVLQGATAAGADGLPRTRIRVLTTTYMGATQVAALDELARLNGCEVRVSLDGRRSRLHAKAWLFQRKSGFGCAYVGSANLSYSALMGGLEWTVKFTERGQETLFARARANFDTLWLDGEFTRYVPDDVIVRAALVEALNQQRGRALDAPLPFFDIQPKPYQRDMLDQLALAREHGRNRNLVVAATGTGKTVVAALDYREQAQRLGHRPRLLFVAHRAQILRQALRTYREVLRDHSFGEVMTGGMEVARHDYLFASIDSLTSRRLVEALGPDYWHTIVIDECHRLAADRFHRLASTVRPAQLLGLTATPERTDGQPITPYFTPRPDGAPAVELRLWDALDTQLLTPFEYFGCDDDTDFSGVPWDRPGEVAALNQLVTGNQVRSRLVINEWTRLTGDPRRCKALVFCVSVAHAEFMTRRFNEAGLPALCVTGETPRNEQLRAPHRLANGDVCALVTVDLYNEGVDIPDVDTLLLLRPTQSALLFQQQIGRGLRLSPGKTGCLILDFVGQHRSDFRFDHLLTGITGLTRSEMIDAVEHGFSRLPPGCHIHLQRQTRQQVLRGLRALSQQSWRRLIAEVQAYAAVRRTRTPQLGKFLHDQRIRLEEVYRDSAPSGWSTLLRAAGLLDDQASAQEEARMSQRFGDLLHLDDPTYLALLQRLGKQRGEYIAATEAEQLQLQMLTYQLDPRPQAIHYNELLTRLQVLPSCADELVQLASILGARSTLPAKPIPGLGNAPLQLHGAYRIREILAAIRYYTPERRGPMRAGVLPLASIRTEFLFVTLDKSSGYHDRIAYRDYAITPTRFHWQTQNTAGPDTTAGRRYLESATNGWRFQLFVRVTKADAYRACGPLYITGPDDISGDRPMNIEWTLEVPMTARLFSEFSVLRDQI